MTSTHLTRTDDGTISPVRVLKPLQNWSGVSDDPDFHRIVMEVWNTLKPSDQDRMCDAFRDVGVESGKSVDATADQRDAVYRRMVDEGVRLADGSPLPPLRPTMRVEERLARGLPLRAMGTPAGPGFRRPAISPSGLSQYQPNALLPDPSDDPFDGIDPLPPPEVESGDGHPESDPLESESGGTGSMADAVTELADLLLDVQHAEADADDAAQRVKALRSELAEALRTEQGAKQEHLRLSVDVTAAFERIDRIRAQHRSAHGGREWVPRIRSRDEFPKKADES